MAHRRRRLTEQNDSPLLRIIECDTDTQHHRAVECTSTAQCAACAPGPLVHAPLRGGGGGGGNPRRLRFVVYSRTLSRGASVAQFILNYVRVHLVSDIRDADSGRESLRLRISSRESELEGVVWPLAQCPVGCSAFVVSCPRRVGSDTSSGCLAQHRGPFSSRSTTRSKKVKSEGKRTSSSSAGPGGRQDTKRNTTLQRLSPYSK